MASAIEAVAERADRLRGGRRRGRSRWGVGRRRRRGRQTGLRGIGLRRLLRCTGAHAVAVLPSTGRLGLSQLGGRGVIGAGEGARRDDERLDDHRQENNGSTHGLTSAAHMSTSRTARRTHAPTHAVDDAERLSRENLGPTPFARGRPAWLAREPPVDRRSSWRPATRRRSPSRRARAAPSVGPWTRRGPTVASATRQKERGRQRPIRRWIEPTLPAVATRYPITRSSRASPAGGRARRPASRRRRCTRRRGCGRRR